MKRKRRFFFTAEKAEKRKRFFAAKAPSFFDKMPTERGENAYDKKNGVEKSAIQLMGFVDGLVMGLKGFWVIGLCCREGVRPFGETFARRQKAPLVSLSDHENSKFFHATNHENQLTFLPNL